MVEVLQTFPERILAILIMAALKGSLCTVITATAHLVVVIIIEASLGFLGPGVPPPTPTWGNMLGLASLTVLRLSWWLVLFPGVAIMFTVMCFNLAGDSLSDLLDPRLRGV